MFSRPITDVGNPMYCPEDSANQYIQRLQKLRTSSRSGINSFTRHLNDATISIREASSINNPFVFPSRDQPVNVQSLKRKLTIDIGFSSLDFQRLQKRVRSDSDQYSSFVLSPRQLQPCLRTILDQLPSQDDSSDAVMEKLLPASPAATKPSVPLQRFLQLQSTFFTGMHATDWVYAPQMNYMDVPLVKRPLVRYLIFSPA
jgi:hypothetical protein